MESAVEKKFNAIGIPKYSIKHLKDSYMHMNQNPPTKNKTDEHDKIPSKAGFITLHFIDFKCKVFHMLTSPELG